MMPRRVWTALLGGALLTAPGVQGQSGSSIRTSALFERYTFGSGLSFNAVSQFTVPVGVTIDLGRVGTVALSSGYTRVELTSADPGQLSNQILSGAIDTELRWTYPLLQGRLLILATGAIPTGIKRVRNEELAILGALSSDVIGFSAPAIGSGGNVGGGMIGAVPVGRMALGVGVTYRQPLRYRPLQNDPSRLQPGNEVRVRAGLEGPLGRRTYFRLAGVFARRAKDEIGGQTRNGVGNRYIGYLAINQGIGAATVTGYVFDVFRADPQIQPSAVGAAFLPRGNLLAVGGQGDIKLGGVSLTPRVEFRVSDQAPDTTTTSLQRLGSSARFELGIRRRFTRHFALVVQGSGLTGQVRQAGRDVDVTGFRGEFHLEVVP